MKHGKKKKKKKEKKVNEKNKKKEKKEKLTYLARRFPAWVAACVQRNCPRSRCGTWAGIIGPWLPSDCWDGKISAQIPCI